MQGILAFNDRLLWNRRLSVPSTNDPPCFHLYSCEIDVSRIFRQHYCCGIDLQYLLSSLNSTLVTLTTLLAQQYSCWITVSPCLQQHSFCRIDVAPRFQLYCCGVNLWYLLASYGTLATSVNLRCPTTLSWDLIVFLD